jgi:prolyl 4-hydroxylase
MGGDDVGSTMTVTLLREEPCIRLVENFISFADADYLVGTYRHALARSTVAGPTENETSGARTSSTSFLPDGEDDARIAAIERRAVLLTGIPIKFWETFQLTHYDPGQEYRPHFDWFDESENNRALTIFAYLNDVADEGGGETEFTKLGIKVKPRKGRAVVWKNCAARGNSVVCDPETEHAGTPPLSGEKFGLNCWARTDHYR